MTTLSYKIETKCELTKEKEAIISNGYPVDFLRDVFNILRRHYGYNESMLKQIVTEDLIKALSDNDMNFLELK